MPDGSAYEGHQEAGHVAPALKKIAIMGCAMTSTALAPWDDPGYQIWGCSGGLQPQLKRPPDAYFELHDLPSCRPLWTPEYWDFLCKSEKPVYLIEPHPDIPASVTFPRDELIQAFGRFFFTSSIAWMLAYALHFEQPDEIGLWGVDMADDTEFAHQKPGCHHFISLALHRGITVTIPPESTLSNPPPLYGAAPRNPYTVQAIGLTQRIATQRAEANKRFEAAVHDSKFWEGAAYINEYWLRTLEQDPKSVRGG